tara:strand:+ start:1256 stop:1741 length:486 start_codon:yes stop_codon:yes gene_type:complete
MRLRVSDEDVVDFNNVDCINVDGKKITFGGVTWCIYRNELEAQCVFNNIVNHLNAFDVRFNTQKTDSEDSERKEKAFQMFWNLYDKKVSLTKAKTTFMNLTLKEMGEAVKGVKAYVDSTPNKEWRKNASTWIHQRCWNDEIPEVKNTTNRYVKPKYVTDER